MSGTAIWHGEDGAPYEFQVFDPDTHWNDVPGVYIFAKEGTALGGWEALYIGHTASLKNRLAASHEQLECAARNGMTHIHAHTANNNERIRRYEEFNLIRRYAPICNQRAGTGFTGPRARGPLS